MKIITGLFEPADAFKTINKLIKKGFTREDLSLVSSTNEMPAYLEGEPEDSAAQGAAIGAVAGGAVGALGAWAVPAIPGFEALFAAGMLTTAAGGVIGAFLGSIFSVRAESQTNIDVHEALAGGKYLLVAKLENDQVEEVVAVFEAGNSLNLEVHEIPSP